MAFGGGGVHFVWKPPGLSGPLDIVHPVHPLAPPLLTNHNMYTYTQQGSKPHCPSETFASENRTTAYEQSKIQVRWTLLWTSGFNSKLLYTIHVDIIKTVYPSITFNLSLLLCKLRKSRNIKCRFLTKALISIPAKHFDFHLNRVTSLFTYPPQLANCKYRSHSPVQPF